MKPIWSRPLQLSLCILAGSSSACTANDSELGADDDSESTFETELAVSKEVKIDFGESVASPAGWNDARALKLPGTISLRDSAGSATPFTFTTTKRWNGTQPYGSFANTLGYPLAAAQDGVWGSTTPFEGFAAPNATMVVAHLDGATSYYFKFFASIDKGDQLDRDTTYRVVGAWTASAHFNPTNNNTLSVTLGMKPDASGSVRIEVEKGPQNRTSAGFYHLANVIMSYAATPPASPGCGKPGVTGARSESITVDGDLRRYVIAVPAGYSPNVALPLVFGFHGQGGTGAEFRGNGMTDGGGVEAAANGKAIFVYPDGLVRPTDIPANQTGWLIGNGHDVDLFDALRTQLVETYCIDQTRIFSFGYSYGARMSNELGCLRPGIIRGIAPVKGYGPIGPCASGTVATFINNASDDRKVPIAKGIATRNFWTAKNQCSSATIPVPPSPCVQYSGCMTGKPVRWCQDAGGMHAYPAYVSPAIWHFFSTL